MSADPVKLLSFVLDGGPVWKDHIEALYSRLSRVLYLLRRLTKELYNAISKDGSPNMRFSMRT